MLHFKPFHRRIMTLVLLTVSLADVGCGPGSTQPTKLNAPTKTVVVIRLNMAADKWQAFEITDSDVIEQLDGAIAEDLSRRGEDWMQGRWAFTFLAFVSGEGEVANYPIHNDLFVVRNDARYYGHKTISALNSAFANGNAVRIPDERASELVPDFDGYLKGWR